MSNIYCKKCAISRHLGLETTSPAYSNMTIKRALITWFELGQKNEFRDVCNYYHHLESMEAKLSAEDRARSRAAEFKLVSNPPPISDYLIEYFPNLYHSYRTNDMTMKKRAKLQDVIKIMTVYCKIHSQPLRTLLIEFQDFAKKSKTANTLENIAMYTQKLFLKDELTYCVNMRKTFHFLHKDEQYTYVRMSERETEDLRNVSIETLTLYR